MTLHTPRLLIETLTPAAVPLKLVAWLNDPDVNRYLESRFVTHTLETQQAYAAAQQHYFAIIDCRHGNSTRGNLVGTAHLTIDEPHKVGTLGYLIGPQYAGQGFATEAVKAVTDWALTFLRYVEAGIYAEHKGSRQVLIKADYRRDRLVFDRYLIDGAGHDKCIYRRTAL